MEITDLTKEIKKLTKEVQQMKRILNKIAWAITIENLSKLPSDFDPMIGKHTTSGEYVDLRKDEPKQTNESDRIIDLRGDKRTAIVCGTEMIKHLRNIGWTILTD